MTPDEIIRDWALKLRALLEASDDCTACSFTTSDGVTYSYAVGEGLTVSTDAGGLHYPESALDDEMWLVSDVA